MRITNTGTAAALYATHDPAGPNVELATPKHAGYFRGDVHVQGTLSKTAGTFMIDHPLDPANKYLRHSFVESPDMKNIYDGVVTLDANGEATVSLPSYFDALNRDSRYQLTAIGAPAPSLHVARPITDGQFAIAGGPPGLEVSWQVTGSRNDRSALHRPVVVEEDKALDDRGYYLDPAAFGLPPDKGLAYRENHQSAPTPHTPEP